MKYEELRCPCCGGRLVLDTVRDGQSEELTAWLKEVGTNDSDPSE